MIDLNKDVSDTALVTPITWIRAVQELHVKGNFTALRLSPGAVLRVQAGRSDRGYDIAFDKAVDLLNDGAAEVAEELLDLDADAPLQADLFPALLETILSDVRDVSRPPSQRVSIIEKVVADALTDAKETT